MVSAPYRISRVALPMKVAQAEGRPVGACGWTDGAATPSLRVAFRGALPARRRASVRAVEAASSTAVMGTPRGRTYRASGGSGGPDRIRTGDLQRDRLACWAATPRARGSAGGGV